MEPAAPGPCAQPEGPIVPSPCSSPPPAGSVAGALYLDDRHSFLFTHSPTTVPPSSRGSLTLGPILTGPHTHTHTQEPPPSFQKLLPKSRLPKGKSRVSGSFRVLLFSRSHPTGVRFFASFPLPVTPFPPSSLLPLKGSTVSL